MGNCEENTDIAHFNGRKNQAHNGKFCLISCEDAKNNSKFPIPDRCLNKSKRK